MKYNREAGVDYCTACKQDIPLKSIDARVMDWALDRIGAALHAPAIFGGTVLVESQILLALEAWHVAAGHEYCNFAPHEVALRYVKKKGGPLPFEGEWFAFDKLMREFVRSETGEEV